MQVEETPPPTPPPDLPGWEILADTVAALCKRARAYEEWRGTVKVYDATQPEVVPSMTYYNALLDSVAPERVSVPVLMHAMLEQVTRNAQGEEASAEAEQAFAESLALSMLDTALGGLGLGEDGAGESLGATDPLAQTAGSQGEGGAALDGQPPGRYTLVVSGDALGAAAAGLTTGYVHPVKPSGPQHPRAPSPTSTLDGPLLQHEHSGEEVARPASAGSGSGAAAGEGGEGTEPADGQVQEGERETDPAAPPPPPPGPPAGMGLPMFLPGGELDVDAVEQHMVALLRVPGAERVGMPEQPELDDVARSLRSTALKVRAQNRGLGALWVLQEGCA